MKEKSGFVSFDKSKYLLRTLVIECLVFIVMVDSSVVREVETDEV